MNISNPQLPNQIIEYNGAVLKLKVITLGPWNMDTTEDLTPAHGLTLSKIRSCQVMVTNDAETILYDLCYNQTLQLNAGTITITATNIICKAIRTAWFDGVDFSSGVINRGYAYITYEE